MDFLRKRERYIHQTEQELRRNLSALILQDNDVFLLDVIGNYLNLDSWSGLCTPLLQGQLRKQGSIDLLKSSCNLKFPSCMDWQYPFVNVVVDHTDKFEVYLQNFRTGCKDLISLPDGRKEVFIMDIWKAKDNHLRKELLVLIVLVSMNKMDPNGFLVFVDLSNTHIIQQISFPRAYWEVLWSDTIDAMIVRNVLWIPRRGLLYYWNINHEVVEVTLQTIPLAYTSWSFFYSQSSYLVERCQDSIRVFLLSEGTRSIEITIPSTPVSGFSSVLIESGTLYHQYGDSQTGLMILDRHFISDLLQGIIKVENQIRSPKGAKRIFGGLVFHYDFHNDKVLLYASNK